MYRWPGNVRELKNLIERFVVLSTDPVITYDDLPTVMKECLSPAEGVDRYFHLRSGAGFEEKLATFERGLINETLEKGGGIKTEASVLLGISRYSLLRKMKRLSNAGLFMTPIDLDSLPSRQSPGIHVDRPEP